METHTRTPILALTSAYLLELGKKVRATSQRVRLQITARTLSRDYRKYSS